NGLHGQAAGCGRAAGREGQALKLDGKAGMSVPDSPLLRAGAGFTLECWIKPDREPGAGAMNIITKAGEFMLRVDPLQVGGGVSLFVQSADGGWEPRARGPSPTPGKWHRVLASWDAQKARLWVNRTFASSDKRGPCPPGNAPLVVGGPVEGLAGGFVGLIDEVRIHSVAMPPHALTRLAYGITGPAAAQKREDARFEFDADAEGWQGDEGTSLSVRDGALCATLASEESLLKVTGLAVDAAANPVCTVRMAASGGKRGVCVFVTNKVFKEVPFRLISDGAMHTYTLRCASQPPWDGQIEAVGLRVDGAKDTQVHVDFLRLDATSHAPPDLRVLSLAPERRINGLGTPVIVTAWVRNMGGAVDKATTRLSAPPGVEIQGDATQTVPRLGFDETKEMTWRISANAPTQGDIRVEVACAGAPHAAMARPLSFAKGPDAAAKELARSRPWLNAGYPRAMDFRHVFPQSVAFLEHNTAFLIDFIGDKIPAAQELKRRYPDRLVLMQVNDELNGIWGSWHCVPREFAVKEKLKCDPLIFPMPTFRGYWLLGPGATLNKDMPAEAETCEIEVAETKWFVLTRYGQDYLRDVLVYRRVDGKPDWGHSEYASVTRVDREKKTITIQRWPREAVGEWRGFKAGETYIAPSVGDIYRIFGQGPLIKTWAPNLTKFCPRDPATGMDAVTWWARHFARLWHERIAASEPHPDGLEFDGLDEGLIGDCDSDGTLDGCRIGGINYWRLGLYGFFRLLREGALESGLGLHELRDASQTASGGLGEEHVGAVQNDLGLPEVRDAFRLPHAVVWQGNSELPEVRNYAQAPRSDGQGWKGLGDALILADASNVDGPRCLSLLNGSENEEFPSFQGPQFFPSGLDLYRVWCAEAKRPSCSYLQGRFACETHLDEDWLTAKSRDRFHPDSLVRLSIASACMGTGIYTYRAGSRRDIWSVLQFGELMEYAWDEYHAGREGTFNWLGLPLAEPVRMAEHLGPDLLPSGASAKDWALKATDAGIRVEGPKSSSAEGRQVVEANVVSIEPAGHGPLRRLDGGRSAMLLSPETRQALELDKEYCVEFWISADPQYDEREGARFVDVLRAVGVALSGDDHSGTEQWILAGSRGREVALTLRPRKRQPYRVAFLVGHELGPVRVAGLRLREGCAEVFCRQFERGLVLVNGSAISPHTFDIAKIGGGRKHRRFLGAQAPDVNNGQLVGERVTVPAQDGLLLKVEETR
ncbi:MAG: LamG domain-containing protein, partial [Planctomycetes bacterium]|nr:LamG domain-containing protein [Planctomycetota bacterium]